MTSTRFTRLKRLRLQLDIDQADRKKESPLRKAAKPSSPAVLIATEPPGPSKLTLRRARLSRATRK